VVADGITGYVGESLDELQRAIERVGLIDRAACRRHVKDRFSPAALATGYEGTYQSLTAAGRPLDQRRCTPLAWAVDDASDYICSTAGA
ncbi:MAG TPA: hypothetical protein VHL09_09900, partial [Dehalococcoidia bacterium]|nr:hypothetical protein [Dehalococcoidia bacterium]